MTKCSSYNFIKRLLDVSVALVALILLMPLLIVVGIILKATAEGEVLYLQERVGFRNDTFKIFKFATMLKNSLNMGTGSITLEGDFRVTKFGGFLRKTKINELPQLYNILKGDLTLVGPRPVLEQDWRLYSNEIRSRIYDVKPGLTGIGSIVFRDEEALISEVKGGGYHEFYKTVIAPYKGKLEMWYQENKSISLDLKLLILTALIILIPSNRVHEKWFGDLPKREF
ncbi:sugar transferase [Alphaproteobacteria bacterium]|nr:sugar transferase [Alphaproteobacteria bacterium]